MSVNINPTASQKNMKKLHVSNIFPFTFGYLSVFIKILFSPRYTQRPGGKLPHE
jgi:hypothetical protein